MLGTLLRSLLVLDASSFPSVGGSSGVWRIMRLFKQHDIPCTFYAVARAFEKCPELAKYAAENHEIASHCYVRSPCP